MAGLQTRSRSPHPFRSPGERVRPIELSEQDLAEIQARSPELAADFKSALVLRAIDNVLVHRLVNVYDAWAALDIAYRIPRHKLFATPPETEHRAYARRDFRYHIGRIRYFVDLLREGKSIEPIEILVSRYDASQTDLELVDGHHRLIAARSLLIKQISCIYVGPDDAWNWLRGVPGVRKPACLYTNPHAPKH